MTGVWAVGAHIFGSGIVKEGGFFPRSRERTFIFIARCGNAVFQLIRPRQVLCDDVYLLYVSKPHFLFRLMYCVSCRNCRGFLLLI